jgi:hypothetical protein
MDKNQASQGTPDGIHSTGKRQLFWARFFLLALFLAFSLASLQPGTPVQAADQASPGDKLRIMSLQPGASAPDCSHCERAYVECMASGGGAICAQQYDACLVACLEEGDESSGD